MTSPLACSGCAQPLAVNPRRKGTMCRSCTARVRVKSDAHRRMASAAMRRRWADDGERLGRAARDGLRARLASDEDFRARRLEQSRANGRKTAHIVNTPAGSATRRLAAQRLSERKLAWCPLEYRADYRQLRINGGFRAADARRIIEDQVQRDASRYAATGTLQQATRLGVA